MWLCFFYKVSNARGLQRGARLTERSETRPQRRAEGEEREGNPEGDRGRSETERKLTNRNIKSIYILSLGEGYSARPRLRGGQAQKMQKSESFFAFLCGGARPLADKFDIRSATASRGTRAQRARGNTERAQKKTDRECARSCVKMFLCRRHRNYLLIIFPSGVDLSFPLL